VVNTEREIEAPVKKLLTYLRALFQDYDTYFLATLTFQLLQPDSGTKASWTSTDNADINLILCAFNGYRIIRISKSRG
jgi:hypothetical protein